jgi:catechol 2,3-dioxygenase-like lactoylglutathione lyase family enzyme
MKKITEPGERVLLKAYPSLDILAFDHVGIRVSDLQIALNFYQLLGFVTDPEENHPEHKAIGLINQYGLHINLIEGAETAKTNQFNVLMDTQRKFPGLTHIALVVNNLQNTIQFLSDHGINITEGSLVLNRRKICFIRDPDGNVIELDQLL